MLFADKVLFPWFREPVLFAPDTTHRSPVRMTYTTLQSHVRLEIKWHYIRLTSVLFRFELQQVISAIVYMEISDLCYVPLTLFVNNVCLQNVCFKMIYVMKLCISVLYICKYRNSAI